MYPEDIERAKDIADKLENGQPSAADLVRAANAIRELCGTIFNLQERINYG